MIAIAIFILTYKSALQLAVLQYCTLTSSGAKH